MTLGRAEAEEEDQGRGLYELRESLQLTQEQLAQMLGVSFSTVNRWERGHSAPSSRSRQVLIQLQQQLEGAASEGRRVTTPAPPTSFVGREAELGQLGAVLASTRVLTLTGPAGVGKTRLALELVRRQALEAETVVFVGLDATSDPQEVPSVVASALGLRDVPGTEPVENLIRALRSQPRLVVVDNCEHLVRAVSGLMLDLTTAVHHLRVVATSRVSLGLAGEQVWVVPAMTCRVIPAGGDPVTGPDDAVELFVARAREITPDFDPGDRSGVGELCRRLDGLPLALELAAGWMLLMQPSEMVDRLDDRLDLLATERSPSDRHRTLRAAIEWSDRLLSPTDRITLARLSVFAGPFTLEDAEAVAALPSRVDTLRSLRRLIESSWLTAVPGHAVAGYRLLDSLRAYALELLQGIGTVAEVARAHALHYLAFAGRASAGLQTEEYGRWHDRLGMVGGNLRAALGWAESSGEVELGAELATGLLLWWQRSGRLLEGRDWLGRVGARLPPGMLLGRVRAAEASLASMSGHYDAAVELARAALASLEGTGDDLWIGRAHSVLGGVAKQRADIEAAAGSFGAALDAARRSGDTQQIAVAHNNLGVLAAARGDFGESVGHYRESLRIKRGQRDRRSVAVTLANLADSYTRWGRPADAEPLLVEALGVAGDVDDNPLRTLIELNRGLVRQRLGDPAGAADRFEVAAELAHEAGLRSFEALAWSGRGRALYALGQVLEGCRLVRSGWELATELGDEEVLTEAREALAAVGLTVDPETLPAGLTVRQVEILRLVATGRSNGEIATGLFLSRGTVERHLANIYTKLGIDSRVDATRFALAHGLAPTS